MSRGGVATGGYSSGVALQNRRVEHEIEKPSSRVGDINGIMKRCFHNFSSLHYSQIVINGSKTHPSPIFVCMRIIFPELI